MTALSHLRVIELGSTLAGAYAGRLFAGFGAEVLKVEPPAGDPMRHQGPWAGGRAGPERSLVWQWYQGGKRSVVLDLTRAADRTRLNAWVGEADVVLESLPPGQLAALGLGLEIWERINPGLVLVSISPYGQTGPRRDWRAQEICLYAAAGLMFATGDPVRAPLNAGPAVASLAAGMKAYIAGLMALYAAPARAGAEWIDLSIQEAAADNVEIALAEYTHLGRVLGRNADEHALVPWRCFPCRDGEAAIMGGPIRHWLRTARLFGAPELIDTRLAHMADRMAHRDEVRALMAPWLMAHDKRDIFHAGQSEGMAWGYLADLDEVLESPQYAARETFTTVHHPQLGLLKLLGAPFRPQAAAWRAASAPTLDAHAGQPWARPRDPVPTRRPGVARTGTQGPLTGLRIADFTHDWAGPHAVRVLADYGAEVIKVEYPARLDGMRGADLGRVDQHPRWWEINRNKGSVTLDLHCPDHLAAARALIRTCDIVVDNSRPGVMERFGLGPEVLCAEQPELIVVCLSAHGVGGPWAGYAGYGGAIEALSGAQGLTAYAVGEPPFRVRELDVTNGVMGATAIMTALAQREVTGEGQVVDCAETEASSWLIGEHLLERAVNGVQTLPLGNRHPEHAPQGCYPARGDDRWLVLCVTDQRQWQQLTVLIGRAEWGDDARFADAAGRRDWHDAIDLAIARWTRQQDATAAAIALQAIGVAASPVYTVCDLAEDPHLAARRWWLTHDGGRYPGFPFRCMRGPAPALRRRGPRLGEDNRPVLVDALGLAEQSLPSLGPADLGTAFDLE